MPKKALPKPDLENPATKAAMLGVLALEQHRCEDDDRPFLVQFDQPNTNTGVAIKYGVLAVGAVGCAYAGAELSAMRRAKKD
jgi:hypothetical protein